MSLKRIKGYHLHKDPIEAEASLDVMQSKDGMISGRSVASGFSSAYRWKLPDDTKRTFELCNGERTVEEMLSLLNDDFARNAVIGSVANSCLTRWACLSRQCADVRIAHSYVS